MLQKEVVGVAVAYEEIMRNLELLEGLHEDKVEALSRTLVSSAINTDTLMAIAVLQHQLKKLSAINIYGG